MLLLSKNNKLVKKLSKRTNSIFIPRNLVPYQKYFDLSACGYAQAGQKWQGNFLFIAKALILFNIIFMFPAAYSENISGCKLCNFFNLGSLPYFRNSAYKQISSHDKMFLGYGDFVVIEPQKTITLADIKGAGCITNIWLAFTCDTPNCRRKIVLRMFWDNEKTPSVEVPIGDFFGVGFGEYVHHTSLLVGMSSGGYYSFFPMPFSDHAVIEIKNEMDKSVDSFYYNIGYQSFDKLDEGMGRFHAKWRNEKKLKNRKDYLVLDAKGKGHFVGCVLNMQGYETDKLTFLEGDELIYVDDEKKPSIAGTGTEDYFLSGYYFNKGTFSAPFHGLTIKDREKSRISTYRFRIADAIPFTKSIKVTFEHGLTSFDAVEADYSSAAYWYQEEPHFDFFNFPAPDERNP